MVGVTIPGSITNYGTYTFADCDILTSVIISNGVTCIGAQMFYNCDNLTSITLPDSVAELRVGAFGGCDNLTSVTIPGSVTSIGDVAFRSCASLMNAFFEGDAPNMGSSVFDNVAGDFKVYYQAWSTGFTTPTWQPELYPTYPTSGTEGDFSWAYINNYAEAQITDCNTNVTGVLVVPGTIAGVPVVSIGFFAFSYFTSPLDADTDDDGFEDGVEVTYGLSPITDDSGLVAYIRNNRSVFDLYSSNVVMDVEVGQVLLEVSGGNALLNLQLECSDDLVIWTNAGDVVEWSVPASSGAEFYRIRSSKDE